MISPAQARAARAILRLTVAEVGQAAQVSPNTVVRVEAEKSVNTGTLAVLRQLYEARGVRFTSDGCVCPPATATGGAAE